MTLFGLCDAEMEQMTLTNKSHFYGPGSFVHHSMVIWGLELELPSVHINIGAILAIIGPCDLGIGRMVYK